MDGEKLSAFCRLWEQGMSVCRLLNALADAPEDEAVLDGLTASFQEVKPHLSNSLLKRITYLFSGADITPEDLRNAGARVLKELAVSIGKCLGELLKKCPYVTRADAERLFPLWDEMPHTSSGDFQWMFDLCAKASVSMPAEAFAYTLKLFQEQPKLLSGEGAPHPGYVYRPSEQRTFDRCPICGGTGTPYYRAFAYRMADFGYPDLPVKLWMRCGGCGNLYTWKYPEEFLARAGDAAWLEPRPENEWAATASTSGASLAIWGDILNRLCLYTGGKSLLEVGIGRGELLAVALEMGYAADGVEISLQTAQKVADMLQIPIWRGDFLDYAPDKTYDIITMGDVLEHVMVPEKALQNACRLLKEDGVLWLSTPNFQSSFSRMLKFSDPMWCEPHHISYFSRNGLEALAGRCGLVLREYHVSRRYNGSMEVIFTKAAEK